MRDEVFRKELIGAIDFMREVYREGPKYTPNRLAHTLLKLGYVSSHLRADRDRIGVYTPVCDLTEKGRRLVEAIDTFEQEVISAKLKIDSNFIAPYLESLGKEAAKHRRGDDLHV